jgi:hypothetical protein
MTVGGKEISTEAVLKFAGKLATWLVFGIWISAKISIGFEYMQADIRRLDATVKELSARMDRHIDATQTKGK